MVWPVLQKLVSAAHKTTPPYSWAPLAPKTAQHSQGSDLVPSQVSHKGKEKSAQEEQQQERESMYITYKDLSITSTYFELGIKNISTPP